MLITFLRKVEKKKVNIPIFETLKDNAHKMGEKIIDSVQ